ncbi:MAG: phosphatase PAP2 family protein [Candidatus Micrarchaeota archaeon]|nr:phosphatase PAP2 family protein [Candidatus Micrarchaeota archaeon]
MDIAQLFTDAFGLVRPEARFASIALNDTAFAVLFSIALIITLTCFFKEQKLLPFMVASVAIALLLGVSFKAFLQEERPCVETPGKIPCPLDFSLPSLHSLLTFTIAIVAIGNRSFAFYLIYALFAAFSRVYLGVHTITEVAAGLALAFLACVLCEMLWRSLKLPLPPGVHIKHSAARLQA